MPWSRQEDSKCPRIDMWLLWGIQEDRVLRGMEVAQEAMFPTTQSTSVKCLLPGTQFMHLE